MMSLIVTLTSYITTTLHFSPFPIITHLLFPPLLLAPPIVPSLSTHLPSTPPPTITVRHVSSWSVPPLSAACCWRRWRRWWHNLPLDCFFVVRCPLRHAWHWLQTHRTPRRVVFFCDSSLSTSHIVYSACCSSLLWTALAHLPLPCHLSSLY